MTQDIPSCRHTSRTVLRVPDECPKVIADLIKECMSKDADVRPSSASVVECLRAAVADCARAGPTVRYDVFLSHCGDDAKRHIVSHMYTALNQTGISVFFDDRSLPEHNLGDEADAAIKTATMTARVFVFVLTPGFVSEWPMRELRWALQRYYEHDKCKLLPLFLSLDYGAFNNMDTGIINERLNAAPDEKTRTQWRDDLKRLKNFTGLESKRFDGCAAVPWIVLCGASCDAALKRCCFLNRTHCAHTAR